MNAKMLNQVSEPYVAHRCVWWLHSMHCSNEMILSVLLWSATFPRFTFLYNYLVEVNAITPQEDICTIYVNKPNVL